MAAANASTHPTVNVRAQNKLPKAFVSTGVAGSGGAFAALVIAITPLNTTHGSKGVAPDPGKGLFDRRHPGRGFGYSTKPSLARDQSSPSCGLQYDSGVKSGDPAILAGASNTTWRPPYWIRRLRDVGRDPTRLVVGGVESKGKRPRTCGTAGRLGAMGQP